MAVVWQTSTFRAVPCKTCATGAPGTGPPPITAPVCCSLRRLRYRSPSCVVRQQYTMDAVRAVMHCHKPVVHESPRPVHSFVRDVRNHRNSQTLRPSCHYSLPSLSRCGVNACVTTRACYKATLDASPVDGCPCMPPQSTRPRPNSTVTRRADPPTGGRCNLKDRRSNFMGRRRSRGMRPKEPRVK